MPAACYFLALPAEICTWPATSDVWEKLDPQYFEV